MYNIFSEILKLKIFSQLFYITIQYNFFVLQYKTIENCIRKFFYNFETENFWLIFQLNLISIKFFYYRNIIIEFIIENIIIEIKTRT